MTTVIRARNINHALRQGLGLLLNQGIEEESRNGKVLVAPSPVMTIYANPQQRVLFNPIRDANPFFHFMESLWMLAGRNDVAFVKHYASGMGAFSDDGETLHGAYGFRWRDALGFDQLDVIIEELSTNPTTRRCVLQMWDSGDMEDLKLAVSGGKDVPCNTHTYFDTIGGKLNMTVCCRSNDMVWGAYGANAVHFSFLLEYVARMAGLRIGEYRQFSNNFHMYIERPDVKKLITHHLWQVSDRRSYDAYSVTGSDSSVGTIAIMRDWEREAWHEDLALFFRQWDMNPGLMDPHRFQTAFFILTVLPLHNAFAVHKNGNTELGEALCQQIEAKDWQLACKEWMQRRLANKQAKEQK